MKNTCLVATLFTTTLSVQALPKCPQPEVMERTIAPPNVAIAPYHNALNRFITWLPNYHMIHDEVTAAGQPVTVTAKFDYGSIAHKDLEFETVHFYLRGEHDPDWQFIEQAITNHDGKASVSLPPLTAGQYRLYAAVPADGTGTQGFLSVIDPNTPAVLFDIDGTLTESDVEQIGDYTGIKRAEPKEAAYALVRRYIDLGYQPIYLTARVYWYAKGTRSWLSWMNLPQGYLRTSLSNETSLFRTAEYKTTQINQLKAKGLNIVRAYGNAKTDAQAFINSGVGASNSFTIGEDAGHFGTSAILGNSYREHITQEVDTFPLAQCE
ncbi:LNS2 domain-containing protein [Pseudoalteromonas aurantia]|uniref:Phosphatidylinositol transfer protein n=1 Tax=Pseudoalteromonas aurantia TaxID=43654 RepID=A0ABY2VXV4_9GAMM|nr:phosphatidylinositol transfer protein [Pseudoalteromonas aurantia]TMO59545.1 phosphatidylinositol transfer protein [Pseudoalteromonas aurantia]TMO74559.1 phosphatidylinositol transfer protein [Pseudoalteromonas aurantia]